MPKRKNRNLHKEIIAGIRGFLDNKKGGPLYTMVELHTTSMRRMPAQLKGVPDLIISDWYGTTYVEIKPIYTKSRDKLNPDQCRFAVDIYPILSDRVRYWIVEDADEFVALWKAGNHLYIQSVHQDTIRDWANEVGREIPWLSG